MVLVGTMVIAPQLAIYSQATGRPIVSSYGDRGFNFLSPHLWGVLFSVQKGLFFWLPLLLGAVAGFVVGERKKLPPLAGTMVVIIRDRYLIASWWDWHLTKRDCSDLPVLVSIAIDDRQADEFVLRDAQWRAHELQLPPPGHRRLRRIDVRVDRVRPGLRGVRRSECCGEGLEFGEA